MEQEKRKLIQTWLPKVWEKSEKGLINQRLASCIIGISDQAVKKAGEKKAIKVYEFENIKMYSYADVLEYKTIRDEAIREATKFDEIQRLKKEDPEEAKKRTHEEWEAYERELDRREKATEEARDYYESGQYQEDMIDKAEDAKEEARHHYEALIEKHKEMKEFIREQENIIAKMGGYGFNKK